MIIYLLFPLIVLILDYEVYKNYRAKGGTLVNFWLSAIGIGMLAMGLPFLVAPSITMHSAQQITSSSGNVIIPAYNTTSNLSNTTLSYSLLLGELLIFIQLAYTLLMFVYVFSARKRRKYAE